jgi:CubicO group peptidase (beta-lactamase class C family)
VPICQPDRAVGGPLGPAVRRLLDAAVGSGRIPGAVAAAGRGPEVFGPWVAGLADATPGAERPMSAGTIFDIASLTKVAGTATAVLALTATGALGLDDPVTSYLPGFAADLGGRGGREGHEGPVTIRHLLTHTSGLPATAEFYRWCRSRDELVNALLRTPLEAPPGSQVVYSDLGFMTLGEVARVVSGAPLDVTVGELVTGPLGLSSTRFGPLDVPASQVAATEPREGGGPPWTGTVHDENARAAGGVSGHAGLFSTVDDLARFAQWWVSDRDGPVPAALRRAATSDQTPGLCGHRGLGWVRVGDRFDILGPAWPPTAVSHTGFTGTSLALDPPSRVWAVLLTNAVHFGRDHTAIRALRRALHAAVAGALLP